MPAAFSDTLRALERDHARAHWAMGGAGLLLLVGWLCWAVGGEWIVHETSHRARVEVQARALPLAAPLSAQVQTVHVRMGDAVRAGDLLVEWESNDLKARADELQGRMTALEARQASVRLELTLRRTLLAAVQEAQQAQSRVQTQRQTQGLAQRDFQAWLAAQLLADAQDGGAAESDARRAGVEAAQAQALHDQLVHEGVRLLAEGRQAWLHAQAQWQLSARALQDLAAERAALEAQAALLRIEEAQRSLRAPVSGRVGDHLGVAAGQLTQSGQTLLTLVPEGDLLVAADFPVRTLGALREGQAARMRLEGYRWNPQDELELRLLRVAAESRNGWVRAEFRLVPSPLSNGLQHGMPGRVDVAVDRTSPWRVLLRDWTREPAPSLTPGSVPERGGDRMDEHVNHPPPAGGPRP